MWWELGLAKKLLDAGYQIIAFDNRGIPPSDVPPTPYSGSQMAQDTIGLLEHLDRGLYTLMGSSLGGVITQTFALQRPDLVSAAVDAALEIIPAFLLKDPMGLLGQHHVKLRWSKENQ